ncbi:MAG: RNA polymerase sigma factor [Chloroflexota bacterium]
MRRDLVDRARRGDHDAFAVLAGATAGRLDAAARLILRDPDRAQDAVQETLVRCWRDLPTLRDPDRFDAWLNRLFLNACKDQLRHARRRSVEVALPESLPYAMADSQSALADRDQIERGLRRLYPDQRVVIVLHYFPPATLDAAAAMGIPVGTGEAWPIAPRRRSGPPSTPTRVVRRAVGSLRMNERDRSSTCGCSTSHRRDGPRRRPPISARCWRGRGAPGQRVQGQPRKVAPMELVLSVARSPCLCGCWRSSR